MGSGGDIGVIKAMRALQGYTTSGSTYYIGLPGLRKGFGDHARLCASLLQRGVKMIRYRSFSAWVDTEGT